MVAVGLLGCGGGASGPCAEVAPELEGLCLYDSLGQVGEGEQLEHCGRIDALDLRDRCLAASSLGSSSYALAAERCAVMQAGVWQDECYFVAIDTHRADMDPVSVASECATRAKRFSKQCMDHACGTWSKDMAKSAPRHWFTKESFEDQVRAVVAASDHRPYFCMELAGKLLRETGREDRCAGLIGGHLEPRLCPVGSGPPALERADQIFWADEGIERWW